MEGALGDGDEDFDVAATVIAGAMDIEPAGREVVSAAVVARPDAPHADSETVAANPKAAISATVI